ncbi:FAD-dependent monooxygenase [Streptomyces sp. NPDC035033]|uniref:FAD-dependent monooxygenase n=1 Tax=Streptomyces sp. NPDC035033 TaxID=3155368 RepID=UPI0033F46877
MRSDVIVIGAGPTGLVLAAELRLGGAEVLVVERLPEPTRQSRGLGFTARAMEAFDQRGLLPRFGEIETSPQGHFGGVRFDYTVLDGAHFGARGIPQSQVEQVLADWAVERGARLRRGWEVVALDDDGASVELTCDTPEGPRKVTAAYAVGCDGGRSTVRRLAGFAFPGTPATRTMYLADVAGLAVRPRPLGERNPRGMVMAAPLGDGLDRIVVCPSKSPTADADTGSAPRFEEVAAAWERITGESLRGGSATWASSFTDATRQASEYRRGRVLLAGDAAHIHLPAGGQGMSLGILDAMNLGWKLAAVVRGDAPPMLLDTYHQERHPVAERVLELTRAQGTIFLGGEESEPLRTLLGELLEHDEVKRHLAGAVSGLDVRYHDPEETHPLVGRRLPPSPLRTDDGATSTAHLLRHGHAVVLNPTGSAAIRSAAEPWKDRVLTVTPMPVADTPPPATDTVLVRPDGHIAWAGTDPAGLASALTRWFGPRTHPR